MFIEEFNVSKVYRLSTRSLMHTHSSMWANCTCATSDEYPDIFTAAAKQKVKDILEYDYASHYVECSLSLERSVGICYNDSIESIEVTSDIELAALREPAEMLKAVSTLDIIDDIKEKFVDWHDQDRPASAKIFSVIIDSDGMTTGLVTTPRPHDPKWDDTPFGQFINEFKKFWSHNEVFVKHTKGDTGVSLRILHKYDTRYYSFPGLTTIDTRKLTGINWKKKEKTITERRNIYIDVVKDKWKMISEDDATWIRSLIDHEDQEIDFEFEFNGDKTLRDVLVYKREVKDFKVSRP